MHGGDFDEVDFFAALSRVRALLIGRRALVALGAPVLTSDYDIWLHPDDIEAFNASVVDLDLSPTHTPAAARARGRYVLENDEHVDVLVARSVSTKEGQPLRFDDAWARRQRLPFVRGELALPSIDDLILTKRWSQRPRDLTDIELLEAILARRGGP